MLRSTLLIVKNVTVTHNKKYSETGTSKPKSFCTKETSNILANATRSGPGAVSVDWGTQICHRTATVLSSWVGMSAKRIERCWDERSVLHLKLPTKDTRSTGAKYSYCWIREAGPRILAVSHLLAYADDDGVKGLDRQWSNGAMRTIDTRSLVVSLVVRSPDRHGTSIRYIRHSHGLTVGH